MSDRALHDASDIGLPDDELFDDAYLDDATSPEPVAEPAPPPPARADGIDALAEPGVRRGTGSGGGAGGGRASMATRPGLRERIRSSRYGTLVVLLVTALLVAGGMYGVSAIQSSNTRAADGTTAVSLPGTSKVPPPKVGSPAQDFTLTAIDGSKVSLSQYKGKPVWIVFGASWCAACQAEVADIEAANKEYGPQGVVIIGINISEGQDAVRDYAKRVGLTFPIGADTESAIADAYRVSAIPAHFFVDKDGILRELRQGGVSAETISTSLKGLMTQ